MLDSAVPLKSKPYVDRDISLAVFGPPDPTQRPMYCKHLVYQGTTEFSFEELRAIKFRKAAAEALLERERAEVRLMTKEVEEKQMLLLRQQEELEQKQKEFAAQQESLMKQQREEIERMRLESLARQEEEFRKLRDEMLAKMEAPKKVSRCPSVASESSGATSHLPSLQTSSRDSSSGRKSSLLEDTVSLLKADPKVILPRFFSPPSSSLS